MITIMSAVQFRKQKKYGVLLLRLFCTKTDLLARLRVPRARLHLLQARDVCDCLFIMNSTDHITPHASIGEKWQPKSMFLDSINIHEAEGQRPRRDARTNPLRVSGPPK